jgi:hypothetical protein
LDIAQAKLKVPKEKRCRQDDSEDPEVSLKSAPLQNDHFLFSSFITIGLNF